MLGLTKKEAKYTDACTRQQLRCGGRRGTPYAKGPSLSDASHSHRRFMHHRRADPKIWETVDAPPGSHSGFLHADDPWQISRKRLAAYCDSGRCACPSRERALYGHVCKAVGALSYIQRRQRETAENVDERIKL